MSAPQNSIDRFLILCTGEPPPPFLALPLAIVTHNFVFPSRYILPWLSHLKSYSRLLVQSPSFKVAADVAAVASIQTPKAGKKKWLFFNLTTSKP